MALNVYRRHGSHCPGGRALHEMTYEAMSFVAVGRNAPALSMHPALSTNNLSARIPSVLSGPTRKPLWPSGILRVRGMEFRNG
jgi:hypothetical protein